MKLIEETRPAFEQLMNERGVGLGVDLTWDAEKGTYRSLDASRLWMIWQEAVNVGQASVLESELYIVAFGSPFNGLSLTGPFVDRVDALEHADLVDDHWEIVTLNSTGD